MSDETGFDQIVRDYAHWRMCSEAEARTYVLSLLADRDAAAKMDYAEVQRLHNDPSAWRTLAFFDGLRGALSTLDAAADLGDEVRTSLAWVVVAQARLILGESEQS